MFFKSLYHAECETGREAIAIKKRLKARGVNTDGPIAVADVCAVLVLGKDLALEEKLREETLRIRLDREEKEGQLIPLELAKAKYLEILLALRRDLEADYKQQGRLDALDRIFKKHHAPD
jgi:hypothetical protein